MVLFLEVLDGLKQGSRFRLVPGHVIGRNSGNIVIEDAKISSQHAQITLDNKDQFVLKDLDSSNGIISGHRRVGKIALMPGVMFQLGRTHFKIVVLEEDQPARDFARVRTWKENLTETLPVDQAINKTADHLGRTFSPSLSLKFTQGIQSDEELFLAYGPRVAGAHCLDIDLQDPEAPELAFELIPGEGVAKIKNLCKSKLTLNNKPVESETLQDGDLIQIGTSVIKVNYV
jgi:pSer/pThr/pTyr-binding forkhead associated (FHA) protein